MHHRRREKQLIRRCHRRWYLYHTTVRARSTSDEPPREQVHFPLTSSSANGIRCFLWLYAACKYLYCHHCDLLQPFLPDSHLVDSRVPHHLHSDLFTVSRHCPAFAF